MWQSQVSHGLFSTHLAATSGVLGSNAGRLSRCNGDLQVANFRGSWLWQICKLLWTGARGFGCLCSYLLRSCGRQRPYPLTISTSYWCDATNSLLLVRNKPQFKAWFWICSVWGSINWGLMTCDLWQQLSHFTYSNCPKTNKNKHPRNLSSPTKKNAITKSHGLKPHFL